MTSDNNQQPPEPNWEAEYWRERFDRLAAAVMLEDDETRDRILKSTRGVMIKSNARPEGSLPLWAGQDPAWDGDEPGYLDKYRG